MKFALVNGERVEASKGVIGICEDCGSKVNARCGEVYVNHWGHKGKRDCDPWWENEKEWHRYWKNKFPKEWQEVTQSNKSGERHRADVKTKSGWTLEFQHSYLKPEQRRSRNAFYTNLIWVVDGTRRKTDATQFQKMLEESEIISNNTNYKIYRIKLPVKCKLLNEWQGSNALTFFDFKDVKDTKQIMLWFLFPKISESAAYLSTFPRNEFIDRHNQNKFDEVMRDFISPCHKQLEIKERNETKLLNLISQINVSGTRDVLMRKQPKRRRL